MKVDIITIVRVANGWVINPGGQSSVSSYEFTHIAATPEDLAAHVKAWAEATDPVAAARATSGLR